MKQVYDIDSAIAAYRDDTGGAYFDADTLRFFGCKVLDASIVVDERHEAREVYFIMRQLRNGFESSTDKVYRVARYVAGTDHRCECCGQRDERGTITTLFHSRDDEGYEMRDFDTLRAARKFVSYVLAHRVDA